MSLSQKEQHALYAVSKFELKTRLDMDKEMSLGDTEVLIFGMGRIGAGVYDELIVDGVKNISGVDSSQDVIEKQDRKNRHVILADATDPDFWTDVNHSEVEMVMLAMPKHIQNLLALEQLQAAGFDGQVSAIANYPDQQKELEELGVQTTYNFYLEAGSGFAEHVTETLFNKYQRKRCPWKLIEDIDKLLAKAGETPE